MNRKLVLLSGYILLLSMIFIPMSYFGQTTCDNKLEVQDIGQTENYPILSTQEAQLIEQNKDTEDLFSQAIIDSIQNGDIFTNEWEPTIENTYQGLKILDLIGSIEMIDADKIAAYIMSRFNSTEGLFHDRYCGFLNYSNCMRKMSYSKIEETAYAVLALDIIDKLDLLTPYEKDYMIVLLKNAIDLYNGGFCHLIDTDYVTGYESSSVKLSYYCYQALNLIEEDPLTTAQKNNLGSFIAGKQSTTGYRNKGGFFDDEMAIYTSIESTYYAIRLLNALDRTSSVNMENLKEFIEKVNSTDYGGIYNRYDPDKLRLGSPQYYSTACALYIDNMLDLNSNIDRERAKDYIETGLNETLGYWPICEYKSPIVDGLGKSYYLFNQYLVVEAYLDAGYSFIPQILYNLNSGILDFKRTVVNNGNETISFMPISRYHPSITKIYENLNYLKECGKLNQLTSFDKEKIYNYTKGCIVSNATGERLRFVEYPGFSYSDIAQKNYYTLPAEFSMIPFNASSLSNYGDGIHQTFAALSIFELLNKLDDAVVDIDFNSLSVEIVNSQILTECDMKGAFLPSSSYKSIIDPDSNYGIIKTTYLGTKCLEIIDSTLGSNYLNEIDVISLKQYLNFLKIENETSMYFSEGYCEDNSNSYWDYTTQVTYYVYLIEETYGFGVIDPLNLQKLSTWILENPEYLGINVDYSYNGAIYATLLGEWLGLNEDHYLHLESLREIYSQWFTSAPSAEYYNILSTGEMHLLSLMHTNIFSSVKFIQNPNLYVGFTASLRIKVSGISELNYDDQQIYLRIYTESSGYSEQYIFSYSESEGFYYYELEEAITMEYYPLFNLELTQKSVNIADRKFEYTVDCNIHSNIDIKSVEDGLTLKTNEILTYNVGLYIDSCKGTNDFKPIDDYNITVKLFDVQKSLIASSEMGSRITIGEMVNSGIQWANIEINTTNIKEHFTMELEISSIYLKNVSCEVNGEIIPNIKTEGDISTCEFSIDVNIEDGPDIPSNFNSKLLIIAAICVFGITVSGYAIKSAMKKKRKSNPITGELASSTTFGLFDLGLKSMEDDIESEDNDGFEDAIEYNEETNDQTYYNQNIDSEGLTEFDEEDTSFEDDISLEDDGVDKSEVYPINDENYEIDPVPSRLSSNDEYYQDENVQEENKKQIVSRFMAGSQFGNGMMEKQVCYASNINLESDFGEKEEERDENRIRLNIDNMSKI
ncbi:MAG: hypothetical protein GF364_14430 [Candidatus Lokiarchaeota archaeon]|nr:hypothetical protein [Candidatus Lokiarchaeota archaeon]